MTDELDDYGCLACSFSHAVAERRKRLRRYLESDQGASAKDIHSTFPCVYGPANENTARDRMMYRDLHAIGARKYILHTGGSHSYYAFWTV